MFSIECRDIEIKDVENPKNDANQALQVGSCTRARLFLKLT